MNKIIRGTRKEISQACYQAAYRDPELVELYNGLNAGERIHGRLPAPENLRFICYGDFNERTSVKIAGAIFCYYKNGQAGIVVEYACKEIDPEATVKLFIHELAHYYLWLNGKEHADNTISFAYTCGDFGGVLYHEMASEIKAFDYSVTKKLRLIR